MVICRICAQATGLTGPEVKGLFECESCGGCGQNGAVDVPTMTFEQKAKARATMDEYHARMVEKAFKDPWSPGRAS